MRIVQISVNIPELYSGINLLENCFIFQLLLFRFVEQDQCLGLIVSSAKASSLYPISSCIQSSLFPTNWLPNALTTRRFSMETALFLALCVCGEFVPPIFFSMSFPYICADQYSVNTQEDSSTELLHFLSAMLSFLILCTENYSNGSLPGLSPLFSSTQRVHQVPSHLFPEPRPGNPPGTVSQRNHRLYFTSYPSLRIVDFCCLIHSLLSSILLSFFFYPLIISGRRVLLVSVMTPWLPSSVFILKINFAYICMPSKAFENALT